MRSEFWLLKKGPATGSSRPPALRLFRRRVGRLLEDRHRLEFQLLDRLQAPVHLLFPAVRFRWYLLDHTFRLHGRRRPMKWTLTVGLLLAGLPSLLAQPPSSDPAWQALE